MAFCLLAWLAAGGFRERYEILRNHAFALTVLLLVALIWMSTTYSVGDPGDIQRHLAKYSKLLFLPLAITLLQEERWRRCSLNAFSIAMGLTLLLSMLSLFIEIPIVKGTSGTLQGNHHVFKDHIAQNLMMAFFVLVMLVKGQDESNRGRRIGYWTVASIGIINVLGFVHGRTGYVALAAALGIFFCFYISPRRRIPAVVGLLIAGALMLPFAEGFRHRMEAAIEEMQTHQPEKVSSVGSRMEMAYISLELIKERPLVGWGTGAYRTKFCERAPVELCPLGGHPHNQFLFFTVQMGVIGLFAYIGMLAAGLSQAWRLPPREKTLAAGLISILIVDSLFHAPFFLVGEAQFFILMLGVVLAQKTAFNSKASTSFQGRSVEDRSC